MLFYIYKNQKDEISSSQDDYSPSSYYSSSRINPEFPLKEEDLELSLKLNIDDCSYNPFEQSILKPLFVDIEPKKACLFSNIEEDTSTKEAIFNQEKDIQLEEEEKKTMIIYVKR